MIIIKSGDIYSPKHLGIRDILIGGGKILKIDESIPNSYDVKVIDASDKIIIPGLIDQHVHITGGGGEGGFHTRVPESQLSSFIKAGITTVVGLLGTDSTTRSVENLVAKAKALNNEGITAFVLTGAYEYPSPTITGSIKRDITFIEEIIGAKIAANDHRDSALTAEELARLGTEARVAGMFSGKSGHVTVHMGSGKFDMEQIIKAIELSNLPNTIFRPTHVNRKKSLCLEALDYAKEGGYIDITCGIPSEITNSEIIKIAKENKIPLENLTFSSDGYGSWSSYDESGNLIEIGVTPIGTLLESIKNLMDEGYSLEEVLPLFSSNVAKSLKLEKRKGALAEGLDADLLVLNKDFELEMAIAKGEIMMDNGEVVKYGTYENVVIG